MDIAVLSAIELVNGYHFLDVDIPPNGNLSTRTITGASDKVKVGLDNIRELIVLLRRFDKYLSRDGGWIHEAQLKIKQTLNVLDKYLTNQSTRT
jgi:hypothetical protein